MAAMSSLAPSPLDAVPNEILLQVLQAFPTQTLLPLAGVSRRFGELVSATHHVRLVEAARLRGHELILECYHASDQLSAPNLFCRPLGTEDDDKDDDEEEDGNDDDDDEDENEDEDEDEDEDGGVEAGPQAEVRRCRPARSLAAMRARYSRFRPVLGEDDRRGRARYPRRDVQEGVAEAVGDEPVGSTVRLEAGTRSSELCVQTNLVQMGPRNGLFNSIVEINEGTIQVGRDWLMAEAGRRVGKGSGGQRGMEDEASILWVDGVKKVGLRVRVVEDEGAPVVMAAGEEPAVAYRLEFDEVVMQTNQLVLAMEASATYKVHHGGNPVAIVAV